MYVKNETKTRRFVEAILWLVRTGRSGANYLRNMASGTVWHIGLGAGAPTKPNGTQDQGLAPKGFPRRGRFRTKLHIVVDALAGTLWVRLDFVLTAEQAHDLKQAPQLLPGRRTDYVIAIKAMLPMPCLIIALFLPDLGKSQNLIQMSTDSRLKRKAQGQ